MSIEVVRQAVVARLPALTDFGERKMKDQFVIVQGLKGRVYGRLVWWWRLRKKDVALRCWR